MSKTTFILLILLTKNPNCSLFGQPFNGGIINNAGDTLRCNIATSPPAAGLRWQPGAYRYDYVVALFKNDSLRIIYPGKIKGYYVTWARDSSHSTNRYYSDSVLYSRGIVNKNTPGVSPVFLQQLITGGHYHLWFYEEAEPGSRNDRNFILEEVSTGKRHYFHTMRRLRKLLSDWPALTRKNKKYAHWYKGKQWMVLDYNKYKSKQ